MSGATGAGASARDVILGRIRAALGDVPPGSAPDETSIPWAYGQEHDTAAPVDSAALFAERVTDYRATLRRTGAHGIADEIAAALAEHGADRVVVPSGLPEQWLSTARTRGVELVADTDLSAADLDRVDAVVTGAAVGIARTGTIVLDHSDGQGRRALTLVPDLHVCVIRVDQVAVDLPPAVAELRDSVTAGRPLTWISGPSATSDIELDRVEGVHGPRSLHVVLVDG